MKRLVEFPNQAYLHCYDCGKTICLTPQQLEEYNNKGDLPCPNCDQNND